MPNPDAETAPDASTTPPVEPPVTAPEGQDDEFDRDRAMHTIRTLREREKEGQRAAKERDALASRLQELEDAQKSEEEKRAEELERLRAADGQHQTERQKWTAERAVLLAAPKAGIADVTLAMAVIDTALIEFDDDGRATNVEDVLADLLEKHPALGGETPKPKLPSTDARAGRTRTEGPTLTAEEMEAAKAIGMDPEDYARWKGVSSADQLATAGKE